MEPQIEQAPDRGVSAIAAGDISHPEFLFAAVRVAKLGDDVHAAVAKRRQLALAFNFDARFLQLFDQQRFVFILGENQHEGKWTSSGTRGA